MGKKGVVYIVLLVLFSSFVLAEFEMEGDERLLRGDFPNTEFSNVGLSVGTFEADDGNAIAYSIVRFSFDNVYFDVEEIEKAELVIDVKGGSVNTLEAEVSRIIEVWDRATFEEKPVVGSNYGGIILNNHGIYNVEITDLVIDWMTNGNNNGVMIEEKNDNINRLSNKEIEVKLRLTFRGCGGCPDVNSDGVVDIIDTVTISTNLFSGDLRYDLNIDGKVRLGDLFCVGRSFGENSEDLVRCQRKGIILPELDSLIQSGCTRCPDIDGNLVLDNKDFDLVSQNIGSFDEIYNIHTYNDEVNREDVECMDEFIRLDLDVNNIASCVDPEDILEIFAATTKMVYTTEDEVDITREPNVIAPLEDNNEDSINDGNNDQEDGIDSSFVNNQNLLSLGRNNTPLILVDERKPISVSATNVIVDNPELPPGYYVDPLTGQEFLNEPSTEIEFTEENKGFIIEFEEEPLSVTKVRLEEEAFNNEKGRIKSMVSKAVAVVLPKSIEPTLYSNIEEKTLIQRDRLLNEHEELKDDISALLGKEINKITGNVVKDKKDIEVLSEFTKSFNGVTLDIGIEEARLISQHEGIKDVYPNLRVNSLLEESVPLINADNVPIDIFAQTCSDDGCLSGEGVTVAVIDTGVDYTHPDLGNTQIPRTFEKITEEPIFFLNWNFKELDQTLVMYNNEVYYPSDTNLIKYSFDSGDSEIIPLPFENVFPVRIAVDDDYIIYFALKLTEDEEGEFVYDGVALYSYDKVGGEHNKLIDINFPDYFPNILGLVSINEGIVTYSKKDLESESWGLYYYNLNTGVEEKIIENSRPIIHQQDGNVISFMYGCKRDPSFYNLETGEIFEIPQSENTHFTLFLPHSIKGGKVLFEKCSFKNERKGIFYIFDTETGEVNEISFDTDVAKGTKIDNGGHYLYTPETRGAIGDGIYYYSKYENSRKIIGYDAELDRTVRINLVRDAYDYDAEGNKICFISGDSHIYCHDYDPNDDYSVPELFNEKVISGYDFVNEDDDPMDDGGHGTHVASTVAGDGILKGVAPNAQIIALKVLSASGSGSFEDIIAAMELSLDPNGDGDFEDHYDIISMSLGAECYNGYSEFCGPDDPGSRAVDNVVSNGIVAVIAAGNSGPNPITVGTPGVSRKAITVAASFDKNWEEEVGYRRDDCLQDPDVVDPIYATTNNLACFSSRGPVIHNNEAIIKPDISAPGVDICAAQWDTAYGLDEFHSGSTKDVHSCQDGNHIAISGTSMATPVVSGAIALIKEAHPDWSPEEIKQVIKNTADDLGQNIISQGYGRINVGNSVISGDPIIVASIDLDVDMSGLSVPIIGSAYSEEDISFSLYYQEGITMEIDGWNLICSNTGTFDNGNLCDWDISSLNGQYSLKLEVNNGDVGVEDYTIVNIKNTIIKEPRPIEEGDQAFLSGREDISVIGTSIINDFEKYTLDICPYRSLWNCWEPDIPCYFERECFTEGITLVNEGTVQVDDDLLAVINPELIDISQPYYLRLKTYSSNGDVNSFDNWIFIEKSLKFEVDIPIVPLGGWAVSMQNQPVIADVDGDRVNDVIITYGDRVRVIDGNGGNVHGWPVELTDTNEDGRLCKVTRPSVVGDVDGDGYSEILVIDWCNQFQLFNHDGTIVPGWPKDNGERYSKKLILEDMNNDEVLDIIDVGVGSINVMDSEGVSLPGWPVPYTGRDAAVADIDRDGFMELVVGAYDTIRILNHDGTLHKMFTFDGSFDFHGNFYLMLGDVDEDSKIEILFMDENRKVFVYDPETGLEAGYPIEFESTFKSIGDLDKDGDLELFGTSFLHINAYHHDGTAVDNFPKYISRSNHPGYHVSIGALNDDEKPDIVTADEGASLYGGHGRLAAVDLLSDQIEGFPIGVEGGMIFSNNVPIEDIDGDGNNELIYHSWHGKLMGNTFSGSSNFNEWTQVGFNSRHTSYYQQKYRGPSMIRNNHQNFLISANLDIILQQKQMEVWLDIRELYSDNIEIFPLQTIFFDDLISVDQLNIDQEGEYRIDVRITNINIEGVPKTNEIETNAEFVVNQDPGVFEDTITDIAVTDLTITDRDDQVIDPEAILPGTVIKFLGTVENQGEIETRLFDVRVEHNRVLNKPEKRVVSNELIHESPIKIVGAFESREVVEYKTWAYWAPEYYGEHSIIFTADSNDVVRELDESNNELRVTYNYDIDLKGSINLRDGVDIDNVVPGDEIEFIIEIENSYPYIIDEVDVVVKYFESGVLVGDIFRREISEIRPNGKRTYFIPWPVTENLMDYEFVLEIDEGDNIEELDETNNIYSLRLNDIGK